MTRTTALPNEREVARWDREHRQECQERSCTLPHRMLAFADWYIVIAAEAERGWKAEARADLLARLRADVEGLRPLVDYEDIPSLRAAFSRILDRAAQP